MVFKAKLFCVEANVTVCLEACVNRVGGVRALFNLVGEWVCCQYTLESSVSLLISSRI